MPVLNRDNLDALLRREGLYSSNLTTWRKQRDEGLLIGHVAKKAWAKSRNLKILWLVEVARLQKENQTNAR